MTVCYLAGSESPTLMRTLLEQGCKNVLYSYYHLSDMSREAAIEKVKEKYPDVSLFLDSGAFTYAQQSHKARVPPPAQYVRRYFSYIKAFGHLYDRVAEPDLDGIANQDVTVEKVDEWREEMLQKFPHLNITPVYHAWRGTEVWEQYCKDPRIKCLAIGRSPGTDGQVRRYIDEANRVGKPVHGFAMTKFNTALGYLPYDSVDSSSWLSFQRYGNIYIYQGGRILNLTKENGRDKRIKSFGAYIKARGCDPKKVMALDPQECLEMNIRTWLLIAKKFEILRKQQGLNFHEEPGTVLENSRQKKPRVWTPPSS